MLASIRASMESHAVPVVGEVEEDPPNIDIQIRSLGFFDRIRLFFAQIFTGRSKEEVVHGWLMRTIRDQLAKRNIEGIDARGGAFLEAFAVGIESLRDGAKTLIGAFEIAARRRTELVIALAAHHAPGVHHELIRTKSEAAVRAMNEENERYLKRQLTQKLEEMFGDIPTGSRGTIKNALDQADTIYRLATFPYGGILGSFEGAGQETGRHCAFEYVIRNIENLDALLSALTGPIDLTLLEILVMMNTVSTEGREDEERFQETVRDGLAELTEAIDAYRVFAQSFPLTRIVRLVKEDPWWHPRVEHGGEDWIALYRAFFVERIQRVVLRVSLSGQIQRHLDTLRDLGHGPLEPIIGLPDGRTGIDSTVWYQGLAVKTLAGPVWSSILQRLKIVLTSGEFYKSSNRAQFNDAYNEFEKIPPRVAQIEEQLRPDGAWGVGLSGDIEEKQRANLVKRIDEEVRGAVNTTQVTVEMLVNLLGGILYARPGSSYDTLANYGQIGGRRNAEFIDELKETHATLQGFMTVIGEFDALEKRAAENEIVLDKTLDNG